MPTLEWLRKEFHYGYSSGDVLAWFPDKHRREEERQIVGSYRRFFMREVKPRLRPDSKVLELGPGRGSWSRSLLKYLPQGELHTVDFQDVSQWLQPKLHGGRLTCHQVTDNTMAPVPDTYFDLFFSLGVLCHNNSADIQTVLTNARKKVKPGGIAIQHYGDWKKLDALGWAPHHNIPKDFQNKRDDEIWWPRNDQVTMRRCCENAGWKVVSIDLGSFGRDSVALLENPR